MTFNTFKLRRSCYLDINQVIAIDAKVVLLPYTEEGFASEKSKYVEFTQDELNEYTIYIKVAFHTTYFEYPAMAEIKKFKSENKKAVGDIASELRRLYDSDAVVAILEHIVNEFMGLKDKSVAVESYLENIVNDPKNKLGAELVSVVNNIYNTAMNKNKTNKIGSTILNIKASKLKSKK